MVFLPVGVKRRSTRHFELEAGAQRARSIPRATFRQVVPVSRSTKASAARLRWSATRAVNPARDFQTSRARLPLHEGERSETEMERSGRLRRPTFGQGVPVSRATKASEASMSGAGDGVQRPEYQSLSQVHLSSRLSALLTGRFESAGAPGRNILQGRVVTYAIRLITCPRPTKWLDQEAGATTN